MPNLKSSKKSARTEKAKSVSNVAYTSKVKNSIKKLEKAVKNKEKEQANEQLKVAIQSIDKCASKGLMKKNTSDRQKSRLNKKVKEM